MATILRPEDRQLKQLEREGQPTTPIKMQYIRGDDPYVHMTQVPPGFEIDLHSHSETEVTVILSGSVQVGDQTCGAGTVLVIDADEQYGLRAGDDEPLTFLVIRPRKAAYKAAG